ncbi:hypothetical protein [Streptomyces sp. NPDC088725]|uniref:hypothetical protein n=1 Tax=Streptomyces sp. NPDC088725 TaxID=3365873 RepID=UPI0038213D7C
MSQFLTALVAGATILTLVLATDLGHRRITRWRAPRSVLAVVIVVAILVRSVPTAGNDLSLQLAGIGAGVICGLIAGALLPVCRDEAGELRTIGGAGYAAVWIVLSGARVVFAYGSEHWFGEGLIRFSVDYGLSGQDVYANSFVFMSLAMVLARTGALLVKVRRLRAAEAAVAGAPRTGSEQASGTGAL